MPPDLALVSPQSHTEVDLIVRPVRTCDEYLASSRLRFQCFRRLLEGRHLESLDESTCLDMDAFDAWSHHLGLFARNAADEECLVGAVRLACDEPSPQLELLDAALGQQAHLHRALNSARTAELPMLAWLAQAASLRPIYQARVKAGARIVESSRRCASIRGRRMAAKLGGSAGAFMVEACLAYGFEIARWSQALFACPEAHRPAHEALGARVMRGGAPVFHSQLGMSALAMELEPTELPCPVSARVHVLAAAFRAEGEMRLSSVARAASRVA